MVVKNALVVKRRGSVRVDTGDSCQKFYFMGNDF